MVLHPCRPGQKSAEQIFNSVLSGALNQDARESPRLSELSAAMAQPSLPGRVCVAERQVPFPEDRCGRESFGLPRAGPAF